MCGALLALAANHVPVNVTVVIPSVENRISPESYIPGDVIGSMAGKSIEIGNTDAEGRLILADAVTYAVREEGRRQGGGYCHPHRRGGGDVRLHHRRVPLQ